MDVLDWVISVFLGLAAVAYMLMSVVYLHDVFIDVKQGGSMQRILGDFIRIMFLMVLMGLGLYLADPANVVVFQGMAIAVFLVGGTHLTRRVLMHKLDLQLTALKAIEEKNLPAAIVFCAVVWLLVQVMNLSMQVLK